MASFAFRVNAATNFRIQSKSFFGGSHRFWKSLLHKQRVGLFIRGVPG